MTVRSSFVIQYCFDKIIICLRQLRMSSGKKIILEHFRKQKDFLSQLEAKISRLETATKQKLHQFSESSKKSKLYADKNYDLSGVKKNLFETTLKYMEPQEEPKLKPRYLTSPDEKYQSSKKEERVRLTQEPQSSTQYDELAQLQRENRKLRNKLQISDEDKLQSQIQLLELVEHLQGSLQKHLARKLKR